ncbi:Eukaryotic/viral aspartic protease, active site [Phytophthora cinnamomi]|uniref:Eukaryotic/viral aspartic protease, active site n=1 Tax=Phytophthora cinnamomi TaxID=4785 RepID=UPI00355ABDFA|nr:Eukaryotic/viral aspartic protease, active site [Phytophthora cinnamomi]
MVPRPGSTTPEKEEEVVIKQEPGADASSVARSPTTSEHEEGPAASWSSEGTFTTGHGASDEKEGYEEQIAVPDVASPAEATKGSDASQSPTGRKPAKAEDRQSPSAKVAAKRKTKKKKKLRAPGSADESPSKPGGKDAGHQYTAREMEYALSRTELFRLLERDPILRFVQPKLMSKLTGPIQAPEVASLTSVRRATQTLFEILRESGFVLDAFEIDIYNMDETGLCYAMAPTRSICTKKMRGVKKKKTRITLVMTGNADGRDALPILYLGHGKNPRRFNKKSAEDLGFNYTANTKAWMTRAIRCGASTSRYVRRHLPPNTTAFLQPMDAGIIASFKAAYQKKQFRRVYNKLREHATIKNVPYAIDQLQAMLWSDEIWREIISKETIKNCFRHTGICYLGPNDKPGNEASSSYGHDVNVGEVIFRLSTAQV